MANPISVKYAYVDGAHFFTSDDPVAAGLCSASTNLKDAFDDVAVQLNAILNLDHGILHPNYQPAVSYEQFIDDLLVRLKEDLSRTETPAVRTLTPSMSRPSRRPSHGLRRARLDTRYVAWKINNQHQAA